MSRATWLCTGYQSWSLVDSKVEILAEVREGRSGVYNFGMRSFISEQAAQAAAELSLGCGDLPL